MGQATGLHVKTKDGDTPLEKADTPTYGTGIFKGKIMDTPRIICQHVLEQPQLALYGEKKSNRVCCPKCHKKGFLVKILETEEINGKLVGTIKKGRKCK